MVKGTKCGERESNDKEMLKLDKIKKTFQEEERGGSGVGADLAAVRRKHSRRCSEGQECGKLKINELAKKTQRTVAKNSAILVKKQSRRSKDISFRLRWTAFTQWSFLQRSCRGCKKGRKRIIRRCAIRRKERTK